MHNLYCYADKIEMGELQFYSTVVQQLLDMQIWKLETKYSRQVKYIKQGKIEWIQNSKQIEYKKKTSEIRCKQPESDSKKENEVSNILQIRKSPKAT